MRQSKGFTLVELIIVITIVGILAAVALPRFINAQNDARIAKAQAMFGSIRSASALAKSRCELDLGTGVVGACTAAAGTVNMDGTNVTMLNRYPAATALGIQAAAQINPVADGLTVIAGAGGICPAAGLAFRVVGAAGTTAGADTCAICYQAAAAGVAPIITIDTSACN